MPDPINKTMERADLELPEALALIDELNELVRELDAKGVSISSWYGGLSLSRSLRTFQALNRGHNYTPLPEAANDELFPWFLYWEIVWLLLNTPLEPGDRVLDMGGSSSLFSFFLASRGFSVTTVDLNRALVAHANQVAEAMSWDLRNEVMDMRHLEFDEPFHRVTSVCVYEHIPASDRVEVNRRVRDVMLPGATLSITFDYLNPSRAARISSPGDIEEQFVQASGLEVRGNRDFHDAGERQLLNPFYHPRAFPRWKIAPILRREFAFAEILRTQVDNDYTFGAMFLVNTARSS
jgi:2-polyprenyl-3-methyl-5-hydroxy-6-metoxy-1,4-benzoquinol methylase